MYVYIYCEVKKIKWLLGVSECVNQFDIVYQQFIDTCICMTLLLSDLDLL